MTDRVRSWTGDMGGHAVLVAGITAVSYPGDVVHGYRNDGTVTAHFALTVFEPGASRARR